MAFSEIDFIIKIRYQIKLLGIIKERAVLNNIDINLKGMT